MPICADAGTDPRRGWMRLDPTDKPGVYRMVFGGGPHKPVEPSPASVPLAGDTESRGEDRPEGE